MVLFIVNRYGLLAFGVIYALSTLVWWEDDLVCGMLALMWVEYKTHQAFLSEVTSLNRLLYRPSRRSYGLASSCEIIGRVQIVSVVVLDVVNVGMYVCGGYPLDDVPDKL